MQCPLGYLEHNAESVWRLLLSCSTDGRRAQGNQSSGMLLGDNWYHLIAGGKQWHCPEQWMTSQLEAILQQQIGVMSWMLLRGTAAFMLSLHFEHNGAHWAHCQLLSLFMSFLCLMWVSPLLVVPVTSSERIKEKLKPCGGPEWFHDDINGHFLPNTILYVLIGSCTSL